MSNALNSKSSYWIRQGIVDELRSFEEFEARVNKIVEEKDRGDVFEIFVEGYLGITTSRRTSPFTVATSPIVNAAISPTRNPA
jgi:hypothetical protein